MNELEHDELDQLVLRTAPRPPAGLQGRLQRRLILARRTPRVMLALAADGLAVAGLAVLGYLLGQALAGEGTLDLLRLALEDTELLRIQPGDYTTALLASSPWPQMLMVLVDLLIVVAITQFVLRATDIDSATSSPGV